MIMARFVNYKKRRVTLPKGCKDLMDVIRPEEPQYSSSFVSHATCSVVSSRTDVRGMVSELGKHVELALQPRGFSSTLTVSSLDDRIRFNVFVHHPDRVVRAAVIVDKTSIPAPAMEEFFEKHKLELRARPAVSGRFRSQEPKLGFFWISPLPSEAGSLSKLAADLFRSVCRLNDNSELRFVHCEMELAS
jgi:hypothetical protein